MPETKCPVCPSSPLVPAVVETGLVGSTCNRCHGQWVPAEAYWKWAEHPPSSPPATAGVDPAADSGPAKRCPDCGHFLARLTVGHGAAYHLDRCGTCGGLWFDAGEWADLRRRGYLPHAVCAPAWQATVARDDRLFAHEQSIRTRLGDADYAEAKRVKAWVAAHPHRAELYAYLTPDEGLPGKRAGAE